MKKVKTVVEGTEYEVLNTKSTAEKIALWFTIIWVLFAVAPATFIAYRNADVIKKFAIVKGISAANGFLADQYSGLQSFIVAKVDLNKLASKITVPDINVDGVVKNTERLSSEAARIETQAKTVSAQVAKITPAINALNAAGGEKVGQAAGLLGRATGANVAAPKPIDITPVTNTVVTNAVAQVDKAVADIVKAAADARAASDQITKEVKNVNAKMKAEVKKAADTLASDFNKGMKDAIEDFGRTQLMKAWSLNDRAYAILVADNFGIATEQLRANTKFIYAEFEKNQVPGLRHAISYINQYWFYLTLIVALAALSLAIIPILMVRKAAKFWTGYVEKCPHCGKLFIPKRAKLNLIKLIKWW